MTGRERIEAVFSGRLPDKVPHFELDFQIQEEAFGIPRTTERELLERFHGADEKGKLAYAYENLSLRKRVIERFGWAATPMGIDFCGHFSGEFMHMAREFLGEDVAIYCYNGEGTYWLMPGDEMMEFAVRLAEDRAGLIEDAKRKCEASIALAERQIRQGAEFICINSDYGYNQGPFISPQMYSEIVTPFLTEIIDAIHSMGRKAMLHSDGDLRLILDQLVSTGIDGYQSVDPQGHMDIAEVRRDYPELLLMGNVQTSLLQDTADAPIRESVRYAMNAAKPGGRYIFSTSNCIFEGMPLKSYEIMLDEYEKLAWY